MWLPSYTPLFPCAILHTSAIDLNKTWPYKTTLSDPLETAPVRPSALNLKYYTANHLAPVLLPSKTRTPQVHQRRFAMHLLCWHAVLRCWQLIKKGLETEPQPSPNRNLKASCWGARNNIGSYKKASKTPRHSSLRGICTTSRLKTYTFYTNTENPIVSLIVWSACFSNPCILSMPRVDFVLGALI